LGKGGDVKGKLGVWGGVSRCPRLKGIVQID
jgi:hypothetical protein